MSTISLNRKINSKRLSKNALEIAQKSIEFGTLFYAPIMEDLNKIINKWVKKFGIGDSITFHADSEGLGVQIRLHKTPDDEEPHSEYLIRRLQLLVAGVDTEQKLDKDDVAISYIYTKDEAEKTGQPLVKNISICDDGYLDDTFGSGFFDEATNLSRKLM